MKKEKDKGYYAQSLSCWAFKSHLWFPSYPYSGTLQLISSLVAKHGANNLKKIKKHPVRGQTVYKFQSKCYSKHLDVCPGLHGCPFSLHIYEVQIKGDFFLSVQNQCVQHHLLKSVAFPRLVAFVKIGCLYMCGFVSIFSILFYWSICLFSSQQHIVLIIIKPRWRSDL